MNEIVRMITRALRSRGIHVFRRGMPWGADLFRDIALLRGLPRNAVIFDVGANEGQTLVRVKEALPLAQVHCFEPADEPFAVLQKAAASFRGVTCHRLALSDSVGRAGLLIADVSVMNQIEPFADIDGQHDVEMSTVDCLSETLSLPRIHLLKIDTEGHDLHVLRGAEGMLRARNIDYVLAEVGFGDADRFVGDIEMRQYLQQFNYRLLCIYDQAPTVYGHGWPHVGLYFANMLFVRAEAYASIAP